MIIGIKCHFHMTTFVTRNKYTYYV